MTLFKKWLRILCATYTVTAVALLLLNYLITGGGDDRVISVGAFLLVFVFAAIYAAGHLILSVTAWSLGARLAVHFPVTVGAAFLLLYLPNTASTTSGKWLMALLTVLFYWIVVAVVLAIRRAMKRHSPGEEPYRSVYRK